MVAELEQRTGTKATLIKGDRGIFDVKADGKLIFSKHKVGRFPNDGEVAGLLSQGELF